MEGKLKVSKYNQCMYRRSCDYTLIVNTGVLLFSDSDTHHADFWIKSEGRLNVLPAFQEVWK